MLAYVTIKNIIFKNPYTSFSNNKGGFIQKIQQTNIPHYTIFELRGSSDETDVKTSNFTFILFFPCILNDYNLLVPTNAHIILIYIYSEMSL